MAAAQGKTRTLAWLAQKGQSDLSAPTAPSAGGAPHTGFTPSHVAALHGRVDSLETLERAGADLGRPCAAGATPLDVAAASDQRDAAAWLRARGAPEGRGRAARHAAR